MRKRIYEIIETATENDRLSNVYDVFMMIVILCSLIPLTFKNVNLVFYWIDRIAMFIFVIDYILRLITADLKLKKGALSFFLYPFTPMALLDLLCILPSVSIISGGFRALKVFRLFRTFRVLRVFKAMRYFRSYYLIKNVFERQKKPLLIVCGIAVVYILISALIVFNIEPDSFDSYFNAIYWATISLTSIGYGDFYPVTVIGKIVTMVSSIFGIALVALPSGIITAGFMEVLRKNDDDID